MCLVMGLIILMMMMMVVGVGVSIAAAHRCTTGGTKGTGTTIAV